MDLSSLPLAHMFLVWSWWMAHWISTMLGFLSWMDDGAHDLGFASWYSARVWLLFYGFLMRETMARWYEGWYLSYSDGAFRGSSTTHEFVTWASTYDTYIMIEDSAMTRISTRRMAHWFLSSLGDCIMVLHTLDWMRERHNYSTTWLGHGISPRVWSLVLACWC